MKNNKKIHLLIKNIILSAGLLSAIAFTAGCGRAIVLKSTEGYPAEYYNGSAISAVTGIYQTIKPALTVPESTGTHSTNNKTPSTSGNSSQSSKGTATDKPATPVSTDAATSTSAEQEPPAETNATPVETTTTPVKTIPTTPSYQQTTPAETIATTQATPVMTENTTKAPDNNQKPAVFNKNSYQALNYKETKGVWISYFELYPVLTNKTAEQLAEGIGEYYDNALALGINTVYVHVRPFGDAIYNSEYYPWSKYCTGYIGENPGYDPLKIMIEQAHKRNISFHAWINPMRCCNDEDMQQLDSSCIIKQWKNNGTGQIVKVDNYWFLNPAHTEVRELIANGVAEIVSGYDVDGVHIDDYFYPTMDSYFDSNEFYNSEYSNLSAFRRDNCSEMVKAMYNAVHTYSNSAIFGISPQGNVINDRDVLYADVEKWCANDGYCDYMAPQIYYGFENGGQPYTEVVQQWDDMLRGTGRDFISGLAVYKIGVEDTWAGAGKYEWINNTEIIKRQIEYSRTADTYSGIILYSYQFIFNPDSSVYDMVQNEISAFSPLLK